MSAADLKDFTLLAEFTDDDRESLFELLEDKSVREGRRIFSEGSEAEGMVLVLEGRVRIKSKRTGATETAEAPLALGGLSLVAVGPRECTVFADTACQTLMLPRTSFRRLVDDHPRTACRLIEALLDEASSLIRGGLDQLAEG